MKSILYGRLRYPWLAHPNAASEPPYSVELSMANGSETMFEKDPRGPPMMTPLQMAFTFGAIAIPTAVLAAKYLFVKKDEVSNEVLLNDGGEERLSTTSTANDEMDSVRSAPWPQELPGLGLIEAYETLKDELLDELDNYEDVPDTARVRLRHALMDRCQVHVAWLLRLEREQRSIERMARRGMMSEVDFQTFSRFAEQLDAEVNEVREEAAWLCDDPERSRQASDEIWCAYPTQC